MTTMAFVKSGKKYGGKTIDAKPKDWDIGIAKNLICPTLETLRRVGFPGKLFGRPRALILLY